MAEFTRDTYTREEARQWWRATTGECHYTKTLDSRINKKSYPKLRDDISELVKEGLIESIGRRDGVYRLIQDLPEPVDWQGVDASKDFPIVLPFDLRKYVWVDAGSTILLGGNKDSSKTGVIMRTVALNMNIVNTVFLTNMEGGLSQIKRRFDATDIEIPVPAPFKVIPMIDNFHDAIKESNTLYAIDYIDVPDTGEYYMIPNAIARVQAKLLGLDSVAFIGLQKNTNSDIPYGGEGVLKKCSLYIALTRISKTICRLKIVSFKKASQEMIERNISPRNMVWEFTDKDEGTNFQVTKSPIEFIDTQDSF